MNKPRIYLDTSVVGGCFDAEFQVWSRKLFEDFLRGAFRPVLSDLVEAELGQAPAEVQSFLADFLLQKPEIVRANDEVYDLVNAYKLRNVLNKRYENDLIHIALATCASVDVLVSWNFKHIVRFDKIRLFNAVNLELGYKQLQIYSPREVVRYDEQDD